MAAKVASLYKQDRRSIAIQTPLGEDVLLLRSLRGDEGLSRLFRFDLELLSTSATVEAKEVVGKNATVGVRMRDGKDRYFNGIISRLSLAGGEGGFTVYRAELVPWTWLLTRTTDCRVFQNLAVPAIVEKVFSDLGFLDVKNRLTKIYPPREYCVQYRETDFNFISRLLEQCGIYYFFEHENGKHTLVLADTSAENRPVNGLEQARYRASKGDNPEPDAISSWAMSVALRPSKYSLAAYNFETPNANLLVQIESPQAPAGAAKYEVYDYPGGYAKRPEGEDVVRLRIEEQETQIVTISGASTCRGLASGARIDLVDYPHDDLNLPYLITSVTHAVSESSYIPTAEDEQKQYENTFTAIPLTVPYRPPRVTPRPIIHGVQTAVVVGKKGEELWVDKHGRVKVQFFWDREGKRDENSSCWVRVSQNWAGKRWGAIFLPRIGQEVLVEFLEGDPDAPIITGRVYNGDQTPPYDLPDEQSKSTLKSSSSKGGAGFNELRFDDKAGAEQVFIHGQRDLDFVIERQSRELIGQEQHVIVTGSRVEQIGQEQHLKVGGDVVLEIAGAQFSSAEKGLFIRAGSRIVLETGGEITLKAGGGFITVGAGGVNIVGTIVNINSGGAAGAGASKAARLPIRATSAGAGGTGDPGTGIPGEPPVAAPDPVLLYREALEKNSAKMSDLDRRDYEAALKELEDAKLRKDLPAMKAAQAKLDAILAKNDIAKPVGADAAIAAAAGVPAPGPTDRKAGYTGPRPAVTWPRRGVSHYLALGDPQVDPAAFAEKLVSVNANFTRMWLCDAWAARGTGETGTYDGYVPVTKLPDGRWDLFAWSEAYFARLREMTDELNARGIIPQYTFLELYTWAERKAGSQSHKAMLWVPNQDRGPWRNNVQGVKWGWSDDPTFFALPDAWLKAFMKKVVETLDGTSWVAEIGNEMPEKEMHQRMAEYLRGACSFKGEITVNRQEDTPGQYYNMKIGGPLFDRIAYHGKDSLAWLDEDFSREPEHRTFRHFFEKGRFEASRIIWSGDGVGGNKSDPSQIYDEPTVLAVVNDAKRRGFSIEHQAREWKLGRFLKGRFNIDDLLSDFTRKLMA